MNKALQMSLAMVLCAMAAAPAIASPDQIELASNAYDGGIEQTVQPEQAPPHMSREQLKEMIKEQRKALRAARHKELLERRKMQAELNNDYVQNAHDAAQRAWINASTLPSTLGTVHF